MKSLYESILDDIDVSIEKGQDIAEEHHILKLLKNPDWFTMSQYNDIEKCIRMRKHRNEWVVDVVSGPYIICHCPEGYITDGSFRFGSVSPSFTIAAKNDEDQCKCKSLEYGPSVTVRDFQVYRCPDLKDLKNCPRHVYTEMYISETGITTLKYLPISAKTLSIKQNKNLKSLKGAKKITVDGNVYFAHNGFDCTEQMIKDAWNVRGTIMADDNPFVQLPL